MRISSERARYQSNYDYYLLPITYYFFYNMWEMLEACSKACTFLATSSGESSGSTGQVAWKMMLPSS